MDDPGMNDGGFLIGVIFGGGLSLTAYWWLERRSIRRFRRSLGLPDKEKGN
jgi:hypothetical protein